MTTNDEPSVTTSYSWTSRQSSDQWYVVWRYDTNALPNNDWSNYCRGSEKACREMYSRLVLDPELRRDVIFGLVREQWSREVIEYQHVEKAIESGPSDV